MIRIVTFLVLLSVLNACSSGSIAYKFHKELQKAPINAYEKIPKGKGIVLVGAKGTVTKYNWRNGIEIDVTAGADFRVVKNRNFSKEINSQARIFPYWGHGGYYYEAFVLDPGVYHVTEVGVPYSDTGNYMKLENNGLDDASQNPLLFSFQVTPNETIYIGDIHLKLEKPFLNNVRFKKIENYEYPVISIQNNEKQAITFLKSKHPLIQGSVLSKLATIGNHSHLKKVDIANTMLSDQSKSESDLITFLKYEK